MNKELEKLEKIASFKVDKIYDIKFENGDSKHYEYETIRDLFSSEFAEIEAALKRLEEHDRLFKKYNIDDNWLEPALYVIKNHFPMDIEAQLKKLKAYEIIIKKMVNLDDLNDAICEDSYHQNNEHNAIDIYNQNRFEYKQLTQEEFDLLKEVL